MNDDDLLTVLCKLRNGDISILTAFNKIRKNSNKDLKDPTNNKNAPDELDV